MLKDSSVLVIGGSSGMGLEIARQALREGAQVTIAARNPERLDRAVERLGGTRTQAVPTDIGDLQQVRSLAARVGLLDHLVITAAELPYGPARQLTESELMRAVRSKLLGPLFAVQSCADQMRPGGSIIFTSGIAARRPIVGGTAAAALNAGLEGLMRALALELAPLRVNAISPGWIDTPIWDTLPGMTEQVKRERFAALRERLPVGHTGEVADVASAALFLMCNRFVTGMTLHVDGGHRLV